MNLQVGAGVGVGKRLAQAVLQDYQSPDGLSLTPALAATANIGSIVLTKDSIFIGAGSFSRTSKSSVLTAVKFIAAREKCDDLRDGSATPHTLRASLLELVRLFENVQHVVISAFGSFVLFGRRNRPEPNVRDSDYGKFTKPWLYPDWRDQGLYEIACETLRETGRAIVSSKGLLEAKENELPKGSVSVLVGIDVNVAALGEHIWEVRERTKKGEALDPEYIRATTGYIKVSNSVNVGFTQSAWIGRGRHHPNMAYFRPHRVLMDEIQDEFPGSCARHGGCIQGLASVSALEERAAWIAAGRPRVWERGSTPRSLREFTDPDDEVWSYAAHYIAQLCQITTAMLAPRRIALSGAVIRGPFQSSEHSQEVRYAWRRDFIEKVRWYFDAEFAGHSLDVNQAPRYADFADLDTFISDRACPWPGLFGGLLVARWDATGKRALGEPDW